MIPRKTAAWLWPVESETGQMKEPIKTTATVNPKKIGRRMLLIDHPGSEWGDYLRGFFEDTSAEVVHPESAKEGGVIFDHLKPEICFANPELLSIAFIQKLKVRCETDGSFHLFQIGNEKASRTQLPYICSFNSSKQGPEFLHKFSRHLKLPERIRILVADDDLEIRALVAEHLQKSSRPIFDVVCAEDGADAIRKIRQQRPDIALLDFRMPRKDGREVYAYIQSLDNGIAVIVYLDMSSSQQIMDLYQIGRPVIIDKGGECSSMVNLSALIKKVFYFENRTLQNTARASLFEREKTQT